MPPLTRHDARPLTANPHRRLLGRGVIVAPPAAPAHLGPLQAKAMHRAPLQRQMCTPAPDEATCGTARRQSPAPAGP
ncbi:hypothetical protein C6570_16155 [Ottowia oryzae]|uniref:Uncharacterized protein n=1 Tax=Ottowia oryzae TaxID=2109914 RepID=A0A2S0MI64_9BURK|nr:hypothetical protein C6570_16155 [Ottowia oryzae]